MINRFIRRAEYARRLGIHFVTTYKWERAGKLPPAEKLSDHVTGWQLVNLPEEQRALFADYPQRKSNR